MWIFQREMEIRYGPEEEIKNHEEAYRNIRTLNEMITKDVEPVIKNGVIFSYNYLNGTRYRIALDGATASVFTKTLAISRERNASVENSGKISYTLNVKVLVGKKEDNKEEPKIVKEIRKAMGNEIQIRDIAEGTVLDSDLF